MITFYHQKVVLRSTFVLLKISKNLKQFDKINWQSLKESPAFVYIFRVVVIVHLIIFAIKNLPWPDLQSALGGCFVHTAVYKVGNS